MRPPDNIISLRDFLTDSGFNVNALEQRIEEYHRMLGLSGEASKHFDDPTGFVEEMEYYDAVEIALRVILWQEEEVIENCKQIYYDDGTGAELAE
jgi:hypothetical protein